MILPLHHSCSPFVVTFLGMRSDLDRRADGPPCSSGDYRRRRFIGLPGRQLGLILAARITLAHFSVSAASRRPNPAGVIGIGTPPRSTMRALSFGSASAVL